MNPGSVPSKNKGPKACTTCARAKARCIAGPEDSLKCERCTRLGKLCVSQTPAPPRVRKSPKLSKIAALEQRLEQLSSQVNDKPTDADEADTPPGTKRSCADGCKDMHWAFPHLFPRENAEVGAVAVATPDSADRSADLSPVAVLARSPLPQKLQLQQLPASPAPTVKPEHMDAMWPTTSEEADGMLEMYHSMFADIYPFVIVPEGMTAAELGQTRPVLWKAIMMMSCFSDGARQLRLGRELVAEISRAAMVDGTKSLDLLHGLQLLLSWFNYALTSPQTTNLLFLARGMCVSLGFNTDTSLEYEERSRNLEGMRAYAGTYYLNTLILTTNKRPDVLPTTDFLETCCRVLGQTMQYPSDEYLIKLVRVQQLAQSISMTMAIDSIRQTTMTLPLTIVVRSFQDQLDQFHSSLPPHIASKHPIRGHLQIARLLLYEIALSDQHATASSVPLTDRLQLLWACLQSVKSFFELRFGERHLTNPRFLGVSSTDFVFAILAGLKLRTLHLPGWNLAQIDAELDLCHVMDLQIDDLVKCIALRREGQAHGGGGGGGGDKEHSPVTPVAGMATPAQTTTTATTMSTPSTRTGPEDPFERLLRHLKLLRDLVKLELERMNESDGDVTAIDIGQDLLKNDMNGQLWQDMGTLDVWNVVGDPDVLGVGFAEGGAMMP